MPTKHRRIGLVVDEDMERALQVYREASGDPASDGRAARDALFGGAVFAAVVRALSRDADTTRSAAVFDELNATLARLDLPESVRAVAADAVQRAAREQLDDVRRRRQLELLGSPNPHGRATLDLADTFDALDA